MPLITVDRTDSFNAWRLKTNQIADQAYNASSTAGVQGPAGSAGQSIQGQQGTQGIQGRQGLQGNQGNQGTQGQQGTQGLQGTQSSQGIQGNQGVQGIAGGASAQGQQGPQGTQGTQGIQGIQGIQGNQAAQGTQGIQGRQGLQGNQGNQGTTGPSTTINATAGSGKIVLVTGVGASTAFTDTAISSDGAGNLSATSYNATSSLRYKTNVRQLNYAYDLVKRLNGVSYDLKDGTKRDEIGLIAEDVRYIIPSVVQLKDGAPDAIDYGRLSAVLIEAVKEIQWRLEKLEQNR